ncbi:sensor histidine kinase [Nocardia sp. CA-084685]|uniref:sensor histidine kinase n=1 Tax=Nocardia sp. CA-084685 TaxID=3239970 RepID=UPI003D99E5C0
MSVGALLIHTLAERHYAPELLDLAADMRTSGRKLELERAIANLLDNADWHGGGVVAITVRQDGAQAVITVDNAGPGVPVPDRVRIFQRFVTARTSRRSASGSGTGIGLAMVAETISGHGGYFECTEPPQAAHD